MRLPSTSLATGFACFIKAITAKVIALLTNVDLGCFGKENMLASLSLPVMPEAAASTSDSAVCCRWPSGYCDQCSVNGAELAADYWAAEAGANRGRWNLYKRRFMFDDNAAEALLAGRPIAEDRRQNWATRYGWP